MTFQLNINREDINMTQTNFTPEEIVGALVLQRGNDSDFWDYPSSYPLTLRGETVRGEKVDSGAEGYNSFVILQFGSQLFKKTGYSSSHYGTDWDGDFYEVEAVEKTVLVYERP